MLKILKYKELFLPVGLTLLFSASVLQAQSSSSAKSISFARAYTAVAEGVSAVSWNPANLAFPKHSSFNLQLIGAGVDVGNLTLSKSTYDQYNGQYLSASDVETILAEVPEDGFKLIADSDVQALGFSVGSFALTIRGCASSNLTVSKDYLKILLEGIYTNQNYDIGNNLGEAIGYSSITASYAFPVSLPLLQRAYFGTNVSYLIGLGYAEVLESYGELYHSGWEVNGDGRVRARYAQGGAGFAFDFGLATIKNGWQFGLMFRNAFSKMNWNSKPEEFEAFFYTERGLNVENASDEDSLDIYLLTGDNKKDIDAFSSSLPSELRFGLARQFRSILVAMDYHQGFSERPGISKKPYMAIGTEWRGIGFLPLRLGFGFGGNYGTLMSTGFGLRLGAFRMDYGVSFNGAVAPSKAGALGMALSTYLQF
jgi:hypothetical protein